MESFAVPTHMSAMKRKTLPLTGSVKKRLVNSTTVPSLMMSVETEARYGRVHFKSRRRLEMLGIENKPDANSNSA